MTENLEKNQSKQSTHSASRSMNVKQKNVEKLIMKAVFGCGSNRWNCAQWRASGLQILVEATTYKRLDMSVVKCQSGSIIALNEK